MVLEALEKGIKPTARQFGMSKNTVRKWLRRFQKEGNDGLIDRRNGPNSIPHKTSKPQENEVVRGSCKNRASREKFDDFDARANFGQLTYPAKERRFTKIGSRGQKGKFLPKWNFARASKGGKIRTALLSCFVELMTFKILG